MSLVSDRTMNITMKKYQTSTGCTLIRVVLMSTHTSYFGHKYENNHKMGRYLNCISTISDFIKG